MAVAQRNVVNAGAPPLPEKPERLGESLRSLRRELGSRQYKKFVRQSFRDLRKADRADDHKDDAKSARGKWQSDSKLVMWPRAIVRKAIHLLLVLFAALFSSR
jgi:hypothetical protein